MWPNRQPHPAQRRTVHASLGRCKQHFIIYFPPKSYRAVATGKASSRASICSKQTVCVHVCVKVCVEVGGDHSRGSRRKRRTRS